MQIVLIANCAPCLTLLSFPPGSNYFSESNSYCGQLTALPSCRCRSFREVSHRHLANQHLTDWLRNALIDLLLPEKKGHVKVDSRCDSTEGRGVLIGGDCLEYTKRKWYGGNDVNDKSTSKKGAMLTDWTPSCTRSTRVCNWDMFQSQFWTYPLVNYPSSLPIRYPVILSPSVFIYPFVTQNDPIILQDWPNIFPTCLAITQIRNNHKQPILSFCHGVPFSSSRSMLYPHLHFLVVEALKSRLLTQNVQ